MQQKIDIQKLSTSEKLGLMEALWEDLSRNPEAVPVPEWHDSVLKEREQRWANGETRAEPWETVKERLKNRW